MHDVQKGDKVRIRRDLKSPKCGWGPMREHLNEIGTVLQDSDCNGKTKVRFPSAHNWWGFAEEFESAYPVWANGTRLKICPDCKIEEIMNGDPMGGTFALLSSYPSLNDRGCKYQLIVIDSDGIRMAKVRCVDILDPFDESPDEFWVLASAFQADTNDDEGDDY